MSTAHFPVDPAPDLSWRVRRAVETLRWAPAPHFEGTVADKLRFVGYVAGSMLAWAVVGVGVAAALGVVLR